MMLRFVSILSLLALGACATAPGAVSGESTLSGQDIQAAVGLYGPWNDRLVLGGQQVYIWRRHAHVADSASDVYCEMRIETNYRTVIARSQTQGFPQACRLFSIRYTSALK